MDLITDAADTNSNVTIVCVQVYKQSSTKQADVECRKKDRTTNTSHNWSVKQFMYARYITSNKHDSSNMNHEICNPVAGLRCAVRLG